MSQLQKLELEQMPEGTLNSRFTSLENCLPLQPHNISRVYFLRRGEEVVYVGQSKSVGRRVANHIDRKLFDSGLVLPVPVEELSSVEQYWIKKLKPVLNRTKGEIRDPRRPKHRFKSRRIQLKGKTYWQVYLGSEIQDGRKKAYRRTFADRSEAEEFAALKKIELYKYGAENIHISKRFWRDALEAHNILAPLGVSITDAAQWWAQRLRQKPVQEQVLKT